MTGIRRTFTALAFGLAALPALADSGSTSRFTILNNCAVDAWMIETPPGSKATVKAQWDWWKTQVGDQYLLKAGKTLSVDVPNKGAPGGNLRFYLGCDADAPTNCVIGALSGDLAGVNTLFEPTFGCDPTLSGSECAFNPSSDAAQYPNCASSPSAANCGPIGADDYIDISAVDGYTIPMSVTVTPPKGADKNNFCVGNRFTTDASMLELSACPGEDETTMYSTDPAQQIVIGAGFSLLNTNDKRQLQACSSPGHWMTSPGVGDPTNPNAQAPDGCNSASFYACAGSCAATGANPGGGASECEIGPKLDGSFGIENTSYVTTLKSLGYKGYTWPYDDAEGLQQCTWGGTMALTLCPNGGTPYDPPK